MRNELSAEIGRAHAAAAADPAPETLSSDCARHHIYFLQAAVELDDPTVFRDFALWCRDLLDSRGIGVERLVERLETIRDELAGRLSRPAAEAVDLATSAALTALAAGHDSPWGESRPLSPACHLYLTASVSGRREQALAITREAVSGAESAVDVYVDIFQSALYEAGRRWQTTGLTIAEEHMATATTQYILSVLQEELPRTGAKNETAVVTGVVGEQHVVGASIVANVLEADGWDVRFIGSDLPHDAIVAAVRDYRASLLAISVTMSGSVADARDLIALVRGSIADPPRIIVGGAAFRRDPQLWRAMGADGFADDARGVAEIARG
ncbi:MAG: cobalamin-dependent protein [Nocardioides sp.]|nr:cobalamin-dependent protein [Nocardioides sp.]